MYESTLYLHMYVRMYVPTYVVTRSTQLMHLCKPSTAAALVECRVVWHCSKTPGDVSLLKKLKIMSCTCHTQVSVPVTPQKAHNS